MTKRVDSDKTWRRKPVWEGTWKFALGLLLLFLIMRFMIYPERAIIKEYREELSIDHQEARGYINRIVHKDNTIYYVFTVDGVEYSGVSRYSLSDKPYPQKGDSIDVYYSEADPHVNLWRGEFPLFLESQKSTDSAVDGIDSIVKNFLNGNLKQHCVRNS